MMMMVIITMKIYIPWIWSLCDGLLHVLFVGLSVLDGFLFLPCVYMLKKIYFEGGQEETYVGCP
jgi:hypothetical protein